MPSPCNNAMLRRASRMLGQVYDEELAASGLRTTQHSLLAQIDKMNGPLSACLRRSLSWTCLPWDILSNP